MEEYKRKEIDDCVLERLVSWIPPEDRLVNVKRPLSYQDFVGTADTGLFDPKDDIDGLYFR